MSDKMLDKNCAINNLHEIINKRTDYAYRNIDSAQFQQFNILVHSGSGLILISKC